jgi:alkanesulfonate monooxygenase SsuD/methylene tetrahydromethanopterin reductase-like flavin-dependent oxidoreductase (luciferase family)
MTYSSALTVCAGATEADVQRRAAAMGRDTAELRENGLAGSPAEIVDKLGSYAEIGATTAYLQVMDLSDLAHLELLASSVLPQV